MSKNRKQQDDGGAATIADPPSSVGTNVGESVDTPLVFNVDLPPPSILPWDQLPPPAPPAMETVLSVHHGEQSSLNSPTPGVVGLPVQYCDRDGTVIPGILQRRPITSPDTWDVKVSLSGAASLVCRSAVRYSPTPRPGYWSFIPGFETNQSADETK